MARPRSEAANRAAIDATVALLVAEGIEGVSMEEVSARSGVAKSTLYRHFGGREELIAAAARVCQAEFATPDTGSLDADLRAVFDAHQASYEEERLNDLLPILLDGARRDPTFESLVEELLEERRRPVRTVIQLAQLRGEVAADLDLDSAVAVVVGPFTYRKMVLRQPVTPEFAELVLQSAAAALRATVDGPVPAG
ncbi:MAG: TetR/AcrR family transcriptional regulator [Actinobacteria bacterium]|nr:TetR/AcrR family transcriptional regulator [Actinomycetota bacterium]